MNDDNGKNRKRWARARAIDIIERAAREVELLESDYALHPYGGLPDAVAALQKIAESLDGSRAAKSDP